MSVRKRKHKKNQRRPRFSEVQDEVFAGYDYSDNNEEAKTQRGHLDGHIKPYETNERFYEAIRKGADAKHPQDMAYWRRELKRRARAVGRYSVFAPSFMILQEFYFTSDGTLRYGNRFAYYRDARTLRTYDAKNDSMLGFPSADIRRDIADAVFTKLCLTDSRIFSRN